MTLNPHPVGVRESLRALISMQLDDLPRAGEGPTVEEDIWRHSVGSGALNVAPGRPRRSRGVGRRRRNVRLFPVTGLSRAYRCVSRCVR